MYVGDLQKISEILTSNLMYTAHFGPTKDIEMAPTNPMNRRHAYSTISTIHKSDS